MLPGSNPEASGCPVFSLESVYLLPSTYGSKSLALCSQVGPFLTKPSHSDSRHRVSFVCHRIPSPPPAPQHSWDLATGPQIFAGWLNLVVHLLSSLGTGTHLPVHLYLISLSSKPSGCGRSWERGNLWFSTVSMTSSSGDWHGLDSPGVVYAQ